MNTCTHWSIQLPAGLPKKSGNNYSSWRTDPLTADEFLRVVASSAMESGCTVFFSSHQLEEVERIASAFRRSRRRLLPVLRHARCRTLCCRTRSQRSDSDANRLAGLARNLSAPCSKGASMYLW